MHNTAIIIGAGIAGCSTAHALATRGMKVTLLERNASIANEASGNPLAMLYPRLSGEDHLSAFALAAYRYSLAFYQQLQLPAQDFNQCGLLQLGFNARELARIHKVAALNMAQAFVQYVSAEQASVIAGTPLAHPALYFPQAAWLSPKALCTRLTQHPNIHVICNEPIQQWTKTDGIFSVESAHNRYQAPILILANAQEARALCPALMIETNAVRGQVSLIQADAHSQTVNTILCGDGYLSPARHANHQHCLGATFSPVANTQVAANMRVENADHLANLEKLGHISPVLKARLQHNIQGGRVSLRCSAQDYFPLAGQLLEASALKAAPPRPSAAIEHLPWVEGLYMNIAHGSKGFTSAPLCAAHIACAITRQPSPIAQHLAALLNPNRFLLKAMGLKRLAKNILPIG